MDIIFIFILCKTTSDIYLKMCNRMKIEKITFPINKFVKIFEQSLKELQTDWK